MTRCKGYRLFFFSSRRRHTRCALVTGVQTCALPIFIASAVVAGRTAPALKGQYTAEQAVRALLAGTDIRVRVTGVAILVGDAGSAAATDTSANDGEAITVTGSRIKGARLASPEIRIDREEIQRAGFGDLGEALRALPQNFSGGQNLGVGKGARSGANTTEIGSASCRERVW